MGAGRIYSSRWRRTLVAGIVVSLLSLLPMMPAGPALADPGELTLVSTSDTGVKGNGSSSRPDVSRDGRLVAFTSGATNLDPEDTDTVQDVYVKDLLTGEISVVSTAGTGVKSNGASWEPHIASDGTKVIFYSSATNLDLADSDTLLDVYVKDLASGDLVLASASATGVKGNGNSSGPMLSGDGMMVVFTSDATNLDPADTDTASDVYVKDLLTDHLTLASTSDTGGGSNSFNVATSIAADGAAVSFLSSATNLVPGDTDELTDSYVKNLVTGDLILASTSSSGEKANEDLFESRLSADGKQLVMVTHALNITLPPTASSRSMSRIWAPATWFSPPPPATGRSPTATASTLRCRPTGPPSSSPRGPGISTLATRTRGPMSSSRTWSPESSPWCRPTHRGSKEKTTATIRRSPPTAHS